MYIKLLEKLFYEVTVEARRMISFTLLSYVAYFVGLFFSFFVRGGIWYHEYWRILVSSRLLM